MDKFFVVYLTAPEVIENWMKNSTPEQRDAGMAEWANWFKENAKQVADIGAPLGKTKQVLPSGIISDVKNSLTGYSIIQAESHDDAAKIFQNHPHFKIPESSIEVLAMIDMSNIKMQ